MLTFLEEQMIEMISDAGLDVVVSTA